MKKFTKGTLTTIVEDDDRRIPDYKAAGWKEAAIEPLPTDAADETLAKAMSDVDDSQPAKDKKSRKGANAPDKKVNEAIKANTAAVAEGEVIDDGLIAQEGK